MCYVYSFEQRKDNYSITSKDPSSLHSTTSPSLISKLGVSLSNPTKKLGSSLMASDNSFLKTLYSS